MDTDVSTWVIVLILFIGGAIASVVLGFILTFLSHDIEYDPAPSEAEGHSEADYIDAEIIDDTDDYPYEDISEVVRDK